MKAQNDNTSGEPEIRQSQPTTSDPHFSSNNQHVPNVHQGEHDYFNVGDEARTNAKNDKYAVVIT